MNGFPYLSVITFLPLAGAVALLFVPKEQHRILRWTALGTSLATFVVAVVMLVQYDAGQAGFQFVERATWVEPLHMQYLLGVDGISLFMVVLTTFLMPLGVLISWRIERQVKNYMMAFLALQTFLLGSFVALDLLLFFFFFEAMLFPMYLIIGGWGSERRLYAAVKFFLYTMGGSA